MKLVMLKHNRVEFPQQGRHVNRGIKNIGVALRFTGLVYNFIINYWPRFKDSLG